MNLTIEEQTARYIRNFAPIEKVDWVEWARNGGITVSTKANTKWPGFYDVWRTPALVGVAYALQDPDIIHVGVRKCVQGGASQLAYSYMLSRAVLDPGPMMFMTANETLMKKRSQGTLIPMIRESEQINAQVMPGKDSITIPHYQFKGCDGYWIGGNSAAAASSMPIRYLHIDEPDKYRQELKEAPNTDLARSRVATYEDFSKILETCTPTGPKGEINLLYEMGDQRKMSVPCQLCGHRQFYNWQQVKFDTALPVEEAAGLARYHCEACGKPWTDGDRMDAVAAAAKLPDYGWVKTAQTKKRGLATFHYPWFLSPFIRVEKVVTNFLNAQGVPSKIQDVVNSYFGETWTPEVIRVSDTALENCKAGYKLGGSPEDCHQIASAVKGLPFKIITHGDIQHKGIWATTSAVWAGGHSALLGVAFLPGEDAFVSLDKFSREEHTIGGIKSGSHLVGVDSGDGQRTMEIYGACIKFGFVAMKGGNNALPLLFQERTWSLETGKSGQGIGGLLIDTGAIKHNLAAMIRRTKIFPPEEFAAGARTLRAGPQFFIPSDVPSAYCAQLLSEEFDIEKGLWVLRQGKAGAAGNHLLDCAVNIYGIAVAAGLVLTAHTGDKKEDKEPDAD